MVLQPSAAAAAVADPVKAFHEDMESEGYTGTTEATLIKISLAIDSFINKDQEL